MKKIKTHLLKRILCFMLAGCILSSSVFLSYANTLTVKAETSVITIIERAVISIASVLAYVVFPEYGTANAILTVLANAGVSIQEYFTDNGDGTYTIKADLVQAFLDSMDDIENSTFNDDDIAQMKSGSYQYKGYVYRSFFNSILNTTIEETYKFSDLQSSLRAGFFVKDDDGAERINFNYYFSCLSAWSFSFSYEQYRYDSLYSSFSSGTSGVTLFQTSASELSNQTYNYSFNFPIFSNANDVENYLKNGTGYEKALNYNNTPMFEYGSNYTGTYSGGDITVSKAVLDGIGAKIDELNATEKSTDEKLDELLDYIQNGGSDDDSGGDSGGGSGGSGSDDDIEGDSWLEKIYNVLKKILDKIKSIRRWVIADTIIDGADLITDWAEDVGTIVVELVKAPVKTFGALLADLEVLNDALTVKFPFCIPWDVAFLVGLLRAEPKTPHYEIPIVLENYGIDEKIEIDLSDFEIISKICRTFLSIIFCYELLQLTMKIVNMKETENHNA